MSTAMFAYRRGLVNVCCAIHVVDACVSRPIVYTTRRWSDTVRPGCSATLNFAALVLSSEYARGYLHCFGK